MPKSDKWSQWLAETRFGGDSKTADTLMRFLTQVRDHLLKNAGLEEGKGVLDVGAGEGLVQRTRFGADVCGSGIRWGAHRVVSECCTGPGDELGCRDEIVRESSDSNERRSNRRNFRR
jgi:hypothetical protein